MTLKELEDSLTEYIDESDISEYLSISQQGTNKILLRMSSSVLFNTAEATITADARIILNRISDVLAEYGDSIDIIEVEGHADSRSVVSAVFPSNRELSSIHAVNVVKYMLEASGLTPEQFSAFGYAEFNPIASNDTEEGMALYKSV